MLVCMEPFARNLQSEMERRGWNQTTLAKRSGLAKATIGRYLSGERTPGLLEATEIAKALGVPLDHLVGISSEIPSVTEREILKLIRLLGEDEARRRLIQAPKNRSNHEAN